jgi:hypothetical protein
MRASAGGAYQGEFIHVHRGGKVAAVAADDEYFLVGRYAEPDEESPEAGTPRPLSQQELDLVLGVDIAMFTLPARPRFPRRVPVSSADGCCAILVPVRCRPQAALYPKPSPVSAPRSASRGAVTERDSTQRPPTRAVAVPSPGQPRREPYLRATVPFPSPSGPSRAVDATCGPRVRSGRNAPYGRAVQPPARPSSPTNNPGQHASRPYRPGMGIPFSSAYRPPAPPRVPVGCPILCVEQLTAATGGSNSSSQMASCWRSSASVSKSTTPARPSPPSSEAKALRPANRPKLGRLSRPPTWPNAASWTTRR